MVKLKLNKKNLGRIIKKINCQELGIIATDTIYGFSCKINDTKSKARIFFAKKRPLEKQLSIIVGTLEQLEEIAILDETSKLIITNQNKSITVVLPSRIDEYKTVGVRITKSKLLKQILAKTGPLFSTSINLAGKEPINNKKELIKNWDADFIAYKRVWRKKPSKIWNGVEKFWIR